ncbi:transketolase C-terminal domain-containing protein [Magnetovibrio sp. PR-2]|uniref:transketolase family protein n=1 Tax=Magnetovibrio sp. PR-2 TaxID=3120356 RepID=UPI002FCDFE83
MEINARSARQWSRLGPRGIFGQAILAVAEEHPDMMVLSADLGGSSGLERFRQAFPDQFLNTGIAEQNMIGVAAGLAKEGHNVFATSFSPFIAMRASEQIRMNLGYMEMNVKAVAIGSGVSMGLLGNSHFGLEDVAVMRAIPNMTVVSPADCAEVVQVVRAAAEFDGPMYIRLTGAAGACTPVYTEEYDFKISKADTLRTGSNVALIACGSMVSEALKTAEVLAEQGVAATVVNMHTIKPLDTDALDQLAGTHPAIVTIEEHSVVGGLGSAVAEYFAPKSDRAPHLSIGLPDEFVKAGEYGYILEQQGLTSAAISERVLNFLKD